MRDATSALVFHTFSYTSQLLNLHFTVARECTLEVQIAGSTTSSIGSWSTITVGRERAIDLVLERSAEPQNFVTIWRPGDTQT